MRMKTFALWALLLASFSLWASPYNRNTAVPVQKVEYATVESVRQVHQQELVEDKNRGWKTFGGALAGGLIGNQFGDGSGRDVATVLGALLGAGMVQNRSPAYQVRELVLVELMVMTDAGERLMVLQDQDPRMHFNAGDEVRLVYLSEGSVRVDKAM
ncbi:outer membrane lipoprotein [Ferrimonas aestuarii]|uniref:Glycine zipper 2TM domain-containing protein n=1 Tax=Ferrimonas aestuarii TaxID=2569539 RepID=A0A4U1BL65_9GAMM|nr:glycine zipper 2TM domain-containing protein [Ferrimonas aestuarii]TKB53258.1 glycine zipper 2TM domain-containing protein [Ferrimonas aestuarii]